LSACGGDDDDASPTSVTEAAPSTAAATTEPATTEPATTAVAPTTEAESPTTAPAELRQVTLLLPGLPGAASGGFVAAATPEIAAAHGLEIELVSGGQGVFNTVPQVAAGEVEFSLSSSSNIYAARAEDVPVVQVFAGYDYPTCLMYHEESGITDFPDLSGHTVAVTPGSAYWEYIKAHFSLTDVTEVNYSGDIAAFAADPGLVQQCISLNEPYIATEQGIAHAELMVSASGFNPYQNVVFTTEDVVADDPELVSALAGAISDGWDAYLADPAPYNETLVEMGSTQSIEQMTWAAPQLAELFSGEIGFSDPDRMKELYDQLVGIGLLDPSLDWEAAFTNDFLP
jgi:NitT/TauT family transport system substrate-binding protein